MTTFEDGKQGNVSGMTESMDQAAPAISPDQPASETADPATLPEISPEKLLSMKDIKKAGKVAIRTMILNKQERIALIKERMKLLNIPILTVQEVLGSDYHSGYDPGHTFDIKELRSKIYSAKRIWVLFYDMQMYEAGLYGTICRACTAMVNNHEITPEELENQRRFAQEEDKAMGCVAMPSAELPSYTAESVKHMKRQEVDAALLSLLEKAKDLLDANAQLALEIAFLKAKYESSSEQDRYSGEETGGDSSDDNEPGEDKGDTSKNKSGNGTDKKENDTKNAGTSKKGSKAKKAGTGKKGNGSKDSGTGNKDSKAEDVDTDGKDSETKDTDTDKKDSETKNAGTSKKESKAQNADTGKEETGQQPKLDYGKADNSKPRRTPGCETKNTQQLPKMKVIHGQKSDEELKELYGLDDSQLPKVKMVLTRVTKEVVMIPAVEVEVQHCFATYVYEDEWEKTGTTGEIKLFNGCKASVDLLANILDSVTYQHLPFERAWKEMSDWGFTINKDALYRWSKRAVFEILEPLYLRLQEVVLSYAHIHIDETFFKVVHDGRKTGSSSYMWVATPGEYEDPRHPVRVFIYDETRGTDVLRMFLKDYEGTISCDGWGDYQVFKKERKKAIKLACCWVHVRRKFYKLCKYRKVFKLPKEKRETNMYYVCYRLLKDIFDEDRKYIKSTLLERAVGRDKHVRPKVDAFFDYLKGLIIMPKSFAEAVNYALNLEEDLRTFLDDPFVPMQNSEAERAAGYFALSRNGFKQIDSIDGAYALSVILSIGGTAQACGANGFLYFKYILEKLPELIKKHGMPVGGKKNDLSWVDSLLPWSDEYKAYEAEKMALYRTAGVKALEYIYTSQGYTAIPIPKKNAA